MMPEVTRRSVLEDALKRETAVLRVYSRGRECREPSPGCEMMFDRQQQKCELLREMIRALQSEPVRRAMADWQREVMDGEVGGLFSGGSDR